MAKGAILRIRRIDQTKNIIANEAPPRRERRMTDTNSATGLKTGPGPLKILGNDEWQRLLEKEDRTSPADYPDMTLITRNELSAVICEGYILAKDLNRAEIERLRSELADLREASEATLEDEQAAHQDTLRLLEAERTAREAAERKAEERFREGIEAAAQYHDARKQHFLKKAAEAFGAEHARFLERAGIHDAFAADIRSLTPSAGSEKEGQSVPTERYRHYKGRLYDVLADGARIEADLTSAVVYRCVSDGSVWVRPYADFHGSIEDGRKRFTLIAAAPASEGGGQSGTSGWKMVPEEPTQAMLAVEVSPLLRLGSGNNGRVQEWRAQIYRAMLAAAPASPAPSAEGS